MLGAADKERSEAEQAGALEAGVGWVEVPWVPYPAWDLSPNWPDSVGLQLEGTHSRSE